MTTPNLEGLTNLFQMNAILGEVLSLKGITEEGIFSKMFPNAEKMLSDPVYAKIIELMIMQTPFSMFKGFNISVLPALNQIFPSLLSKGAGHSK